jgi:H+/Cl- antiporter ClcA
MRKYLDNKVEQVILVTEKLKLFIDSFFSRFQIPEDIRKNFYLSFPLLIASVLVGIVAVVYAKLFLFVERSGIELFSQFPLLFLLILPSCFLVSWLLVHRFAPFARGSGIPQIIAALELSETNQKEKISLLIGFRTIVVKILSSLVLVFGGGAIGREGPTIQVAGSIFHIVGKYIPKQWPKSSERIMILTGSAAGLAAAFNTPLGGIVFAIEELSKSHFNAFRTSLLTAVIVAGMMAQMLLGPYLYLGFPQVSGLVYSMTSIVVLTAIIVGLAGGLFSKLVLWILKYKNSFHTIFSQSVFVVVLSLLLFLTAYFISSSALGSGKETMIALLFGKESTPSLLLVFSRFVGPLLSFISGGAGGIFAPALSCGATMGATMSTYFTMTPEQANVIILVGMVSFLTAVTRSPFTSSILVLEMTDRHSLIFFLMLTGLISYVSAWMVDKKSLYEHLKEGYLKEVAETNV